MKILHVIDCMQNLGGAQEILVNLAKLLPPEQFSQQIIRLHGKNSYADRLPESEVPNFSLAPRKYQLLKIIWGLYTHLKHQRYDIVHLHLQISTVLGVLIARLCGAPNVVVTIYASRPQSSPWVFWAFAMLVPFVDLFVGLTKHQLSGLTEHPLAKLFLKRSATRLIPVGIECAPIDELRKQGSSIRQELHISPDAPLVLNIARFCPRKGQSYLLRAIALVVKAIPDVRCILVGHGPELERLRTLTTELQLAQYVYFLISRSDLHNFLNACDLFVNASIFEGMGVIIYQTMAYAKAVVGFNAGSADEVVINGETGLLVPVRDYQALADAIIRLLNDQNLRAQYGKAGRKRIEEHFLLGDKIKEYEQMYQEMLNVKC
jgi:glycosyltransferase involved in cell wall biosynthesis